MKERCRIARLIAFCLAALLSAALCACSAAGGTATDYDGFTVRTERARPDAVAGEAQAPTATERSQPGQTAEDYVLNKSSGKFHYPSCSAVGEISEKNRWSYHGTREDVIEMGYQPCKICSP